jgi:outer membrane autotransporter protein
VFFGPQNRSSNITSGNGLWGSYILTGNTTESDGNAGKYHLKRHGFVLGYEKAMKGGNSYAGAMFSYNQGKLDAWRADAKSDDFQIGLYHGKNLWNQWEWKNYLGAGIQNYDMRRHIDMNTSQSTWKQESTTFVCEDHTSSGTMRSNFAGLSFAGSTELGRPLYYGQCRQWTVRPYMGLDLTAVWQNRASEHGDFEDDLYEVNGEFYHAADLAALDFDSTKNIRIYGRPGVMVERGGSNGNIRAGVAYSFLMGGHRYTTVTNQFQFAGDKFDLRGVDDGSGFVTANVGISAFVGKRKLCMVGLDYAVAGGSRSTTHAGQLGFQRIF